MRENTELWERLCEQAEVEQDPDKLRLLTQEIDRLLEQKFARLVEEDLKRNQK
jgi:hypothetical protein